MNPKLAEKVGRIPLFLYLIRCSHLLLKLLYFLKGKCLPFFLKNPAEVQNDGNPERQQEPQSKHCAKNSSAMRLNSTLMSCEANWCNQQQYLKIIETPAKKSCTGNKAVEANQKRTQVCRETHNAILLMLLEINLSLSFWPTKQCSCGDIVQKRTITQQEPRTARVRLNSKLNWPPVSLVKSGCERH